MRIGINLTHLNPGHNGGIEHCIRSWLYYFPIFAPQHQYVIFANEKVLTSIDNLSVYERVIIPYGLENLVAITEALKTEIPRHAIDVWWSPLMVLDPLDLDIPCIYVIPDLQHEYYPQFFSAEELHWRRERMQLSLNRADTVVTISHDVKKDLVNILHVPEGKIEVLYLDTEPWFQVRNWQKSEINAVKDTYHLPDEYIFYPANSWPHKNHLRLLEAFVLLKRFFPKLRLVLTGAASNAHTDIKLFIERHNLTHDVYYLGHIPREHMPYIYKLASALVFPSLFEGFGIPLVEAMRSDCPIVASNRTSIPEIAQNAALYFNPENILDIADKLTILLNDKGLQKELVVAGRERSKAFSYERSAAAMIHLFEQAVQSRWHGDGRARTDSMNGPLISIITPSYNQGQFIERTIKSVIEQSYTNVEYIIVDGGSSDQSVEIISRYARLYPHVIQWISEKDKGQAHAINKGLKRAQGNIIAWLNSDDVYVPGALEKVVTFFNEHPDLAFVHGQGHHITKDDQFLGPYPSAVCDFAILHSTCPICQPTAFWRRDVLDQVGYLDESLHFAMDYDYWIRISKVYQLGFIPDHLASTRLYDETKTLGQRHKVHKEIIEVVKRHFGTVHANWIYAYAHTYPAIINNNRKSALKNLSFVCLLTWYSAINFLRYNHYIPLSSVRLFLGWLWAGVTSFYKRV